MRDFLLSIGMLAVLVIFCIVGGAAIGLFIILYALFAGGIMSISERLKEAKNKK